MLLTLFSLALHGFHPYAEDGGVYLPGIERLLKPALYGPHPVFVLAPMRTSLFAPMVAGLVRGTHVPLLWMILLLYALSTLLTLLAGAWIAEQISHSAPGWVAAVALLACWLTLPVAGTSLLLMDPYVTARSLCLPLVLFAVGSVLRRRWLAAALFLGAATAMHPLMAGYGLAAVAAIIANVGGTRRRRQLLMIAFVCAALAIACIVNALGSMESLQYRAVAVTRYYWFLSQWHWYEVMGLAAPLLVLAAFARRGGAASKTLVRAALLLGITATLVAALFARVEMPSLLVARLQPLRALQLIYVVMILRLGAWLGEYFLKGRVLRWLLTLTLAAAPIGYAARQTYAHSDHFEAPWLPPHNPWQQAFLWARDYTPTDAVFAVDPYYITKGIHEDAQTFRAMAERDILADYSKDGGEASVAPALTTAWNEGVTAQTDLDTEDDATRLLALHNLHPSWVLLQVQAKTSWDCPYKNDLVKICALPPWAS